jgi:hypothetical protein
MAESATAHKIERFAPFIVTPPLVVVTVRQRGAAFHPEPEFVTSALWSLLLWITPLKPDDVPRRSSKQLAD